MKVNTFMFNLTSGYASEQVTDLVEVLSCSSKDSYTHIYMPKVKIY